MIKRAAVIGHPIAHSKSPLIHNYWLQKYNIPGNYEALDIAPENLESAVHSLAQDGYIGFNVTIPHKERIFALCDELDAQARAIKAVNTVVIKNGKLHGTNTDIFGFAENIRAVMPDFNFIKGPAVLLGAGGAARAVIYSLLQEGAPEIRLLNRTREKAENLSREFSDISIADWDDRMEILSGANLLINATSMGMNGQPPLDLDLSVLPKDALVNDIVYAPLITPLLKAAESRGNPIVTGIGMLLHQARPAFKAWYGIMPDVDEALEKLVLA